MTPNRPVPMQLPRDGTYAPVGEPDEGPLPRALRLEEQVRALATDIGERHLGRTGSLDAAAEYIGKSFLASRCEIEGQPFEVAGQEVFNICSEQRGLERPEEIVVIGAHYDTVPGCPGANDNGSGVASLLEIARACRPFAFARTLRFVAFVNEEQPFFQTLAMGSFVYARACRARRERIVGMCAIETIGCYRSAPRSQQYPVAALGAFYPTTGNFLAFVGNIRSGRWVRQARGAFRKSSAFPTWAAALPSIVPGISWSDHWAFWKSGYPALMVTDTAPFRYPEYHTPGDTPEKLDYESMSRVVAGLIGMSQILAGRQDV